MADGTGIEWADATWNVVIGCDKVSPGCDHCYAIRTAHRMSAHPNPKVAEVYEGTEADGEWTGQVNLIESRLGLPRTWTKPRRIFVNAQSDLFHADVPDEFIAKVWAVMAACPQHTFQILTKRPARMRSLLTSPRFQFLAGAATHNLIEEGWAPTDEWVWATPLPNVWLGTSVEDQKRADLRIPPLLGTPAAVRFLSCEPLLGPVDLTHMDVEGRLTDGYWINALSGRNADMGRPCADVPSIGWVITGGESGPGARPMHPGWVRSLRDQCVAADVPFLHKQWGEYVEVAEPDHGDVWVLGAGFGSIDTERQGEIGTTPTQPWKPGDVGAEPGRWDPYGDVIVRHVGKRQAGRMLDGREWTEFPEPV